MRFHYLIGCLDDSNVGGLLSRTASSVFCGVIFPVSFVHSPEQYTCSITCFPSMRSDVQPRNHEVCWKRECSFQCFFGHGDEKAGWRHAVTENRSRDCPGTCSQNNMTFGLGPWCRGFGLGQEPWPERPGLNPDFAPMTKGKQLLVLYTPSP